MVSALSEGGDEFTGFSCDWLRVSFIKPEVYGRVVIPGSHESGSKIFTGLVGQEEMATLHPGHAIDDNDVRRPMPLLLQ